MDAIARRVGLDTILNTVLNRHHVCYCMALYGPGFWMPQILKSLSFAGTFRTLPALLLTEELAAVGVGIINSTGNLGGFIGPYAAGFIKDITAVRP